MDGKRKTLCRAAAVLAGVALMWLAGPAAAEEEIAVGDLPAAVVNAVEARLPNSTIDEAVRDVEDGQLIYELEVEAADGTEYDIEITADGEIIEIDSEDEDEDQDGDQDEDEDADDDEDEDEDDEEEEDEDDDDDEDEDDDDDEDDM